MSTATGTQPHAAGTPALNPLPRLALPKNTEPKPRSPQASLPVGGQGHGDLCLLLSSRPPEPPHLPGQHRMVPGFNLPLFFLFISILWGEPAVQHPGPMMASGTWPWGESPLDPGAAGCIYPAAFSRVPSWARSCKAQGMQMGWQGSEGAEDPTTAAFRVEEGRLCHHLQTHRDPREAEEKNASLQHVGRARKA